MQKKIALIFALVILLVSGAVTILTVFLYNERVVEEARRRLHNGRDSVEQHLLARSKAAYDLALFLARRSAYARDVALGNTDRLVIVSEMEEWKKIFGGDYFEIDSNQGKSLIQTDDFFITNRDVSSDALYRIAAQSNKSKPSFGIELYKDTLLLAGAAPIYTGGYFINGVVKAGFVLTQEDIARIAQDTGFAVNVVAPSGRQFTTFPGGKVNTKDFWITRLQLKDVAGKYLNARVTIGIPTNFFVEANRQAQMFVAIITVFMIIGGISLILLLTKRAVIRPLQELTKGAIILGTGNLNHRIREAGTGEIALLAHSFNKMAEDLKIRESKLVAELDTIKTIITDLTDGLIMYTDQGRIILLNPRAARMLGVTAKEAVDKVITKMKRRRNARLENLYALFDDASSGNEPFELRLAGGDERIIEVNTVEISAVNGEPRRFIKVLHDITRERALDRMKSEFISIASHQLRTPLSVIKWTLKLFLNGDLGRVTREQREFMEKTFNSNERMIDLVNDLLDVSRIEEGRFDYKFDKCNLGELLQGILNEYRVLTVNKKLLVRTNFEENHHITIVGDQEKLRLAFSNLIDNAIKFTPRNGQISVTLSRVDRKAHVAVSDTGIGMSKEDLKQLFTKFFRSEGAQRMEAKGTGLGLFIVRNIIEKHKGEIRVTSAPGQGATFTCILPIHSNKIGC